MAENNQEVQCGCPWCKSTEGFTAANIVNAKVVIFGFASNGNPEYGSQSNLDWNSQRLDPTVSSPYVCDKCGESFEKPFPVTETYPEQEMTAGQLRAKYDSLADDSRWGEHHQLKMEDWRYEVQEGNTRVGYWDWVATMIETVL